MADLAAGPRLFVASLRRSCRAHRFTGAGALFASGASAALSWLSVEVLVLLTRLLCREASLQAGTTMCLLESESKLNASRFLPQRS
ncbi:uncharacterized protein [Miscanthus floridulus]|uniref:uncharacterized protein isoform X3 n=1 Tax=Miscanthus floridulus TaxID=154761 RepID=UPI003458213B